MALLSPYLKKDFVRASITFVLLRDHHFHNGHSKSSFILLLSLLLNPWPLPILSISRSRLFFLVAITSARRADTPYLQFHPDKVTLYPDVSFLPKVISDFHLNQPPNYPPFSFFISDIRSRVHASYSGCQMLPGLLCFQDKDFPKVSLSVPLLSRSTQRFPSFIVDSV